jgi:hypothetical protein
VLHKDLSRASMTSWTCCSDDGTPGSTSVLKAAAAGASAKDTRGGVGGSLPESVGVAAGVDLDSRCLCSRLRPGPSMLATELRDPFASKKNESPRGDPIGVAS